MRGAGARENHPLVRKTVSGIITALRLLKGTEGSGRTAHPKEGASRPKMAHLEDAQTSLLGYDVTAKQRADVMEAKRMRLHDFLDHWAEARPGTEFAVQRERRLTYREALDAANRLANAFVAAGLRVGDRIAVLSKNSI